MRRVNRPRWCSQQSILNIDNVAGSIDALSFFGIQYLSEQLNSGTFGRLDVAPARQARDYLLPVGIRRAVNCESDVVLREAIFHAEFATNVVGVA